MCSQLMVQHKVELAWYLLIEFCFNSLDHYLVEGQDYEPFNETITLMPGSLSITVTKRIVNDKYYEAIFEMFEIKMEVPEQPWKSRIVVYGDQITLVVRDDDGQLVRTYLHKVYYVRHTFSHSLSLFLSLTHPL